jgi:hypothetical protein
MKEAFILAVEAYSEMLERDGEEAARARLSAFLESAKKIPDMNVEDVLDRQPAPDVREL